MFVFIDVESKDGSIYDIINYCNCWVLIANFSDIANLIVVYKH